MWHLPMSFGRAACWSGTRACRRGSRTKRSSSMRGARPEGPERTAALDYAREGDTLVVWKLDRLARSIRQLFETVEDLERRKIGLRSLTEAIDTTTPGGRLVFHVFAALAEFERSVI